MVLMGKFRNTYRVLIRMSEGRRPFGRLRHRREVKWIFMKYGGRMWTGFIWRGTGTSGELL